MTKEEREAILARCNKAQNKTIDYDILKSLDDISVLFDALEKSEKEISMLVGDEEILMNDLRSWKARAEEFAAVGTLQEKRVEAAERALKKLMPCSSCTKLDTELCPETIERGTVCGRWEFDETRFAEEISKEKRCE